ncbi:MAG: phage tail protein [Rickettsia endosymbiont of Ixodes persulcatus]|nr:phage tail protein [Rickettsia endosymbiont of Ixodes persulcatus]
MNDGALTLSITKAGKEKIASLLAQTSSAYVKIALGDRYKEFDEEETKLAHERIQTNGKMSIISNNNTVHIQAYLNADETEFDIQEIGLLLQDGNNPATLVGIYRTKEILAKKTAHVDLLLDITLEIHGYAPKDFIINLPKYQPILEMSPASDKKFGTVRLATVNAIQIENNDEFVLSTRNLATEKIIKQKKHGFVLTTNHLDILLTREIIWAQLIDNQSLCEANNALIPLFIGIFYHPYQNIIYSVYGVYEDNVEKSAILCGEYNKKQSGLKIKNFSNSDITSLELSKSSPIFTLNEKNSIDFFFLINSYGINTKNFYKASFVTNSTDLALSEPYEMLKKGKLFIYDNKIGAIDEKNIRFRLLTDLNTSDHILLSREQPNSLVHIIQDKIYCFENSRITIFTLRGSNKVPEVFTQISNSNINLKNAEKYASTVLGNYIYFFKTTNYCINTTDPADSYRYNILDNQWQRFTSPSAKLLNLTPTLSSAITVGNDIYLFIVGTEDENKKLKVSILKCTPP